MRTNTGNLVRTGYTFAGWNTQANGSGTDYAAGGSYTANASVTLYAKWTPITYTVTYNGNGHTGGSTANSSHTYGVSKTLTANGYTQTGYTFAGWATSSGGNVAYGNAASVINLSATQGATVTLYAKWTQNAVYYAIGTGVTPGTAGTSSGDGSKQSGSLCTVTATANPGYTFVNWTEGGTPVSTLASYSFTVDRDRTLLAHFVSSVDSTPPTLAITSPTTGSSWTSGTATVDLAGTAGDNVGVFRITVTSNRDMESLDAAWTGSTWSCEAIPLHQGANYLDVTAWDEAGNATTRMLTVNYTGDSLYDGGLRSGQVVQSIDFPDFVPRGYTVRVRWSVLSYVPVRSYLQTAYRQDNTTVWTVRRNGEGAFGGVSTWNIGNGQKHAAIYVFEADWTAPDCGSDPVDIHVWINVSQMDGQRYVMASIPDGVDERPDDTIAKVFRRTIIPEPSFWSPGTPGGDARDESPFREANAQRNFDSLNDIKKRSGGTVTWLQVPDNWIPGAQITCEWKVLGYMDLEGQFVTADFVNETLPFVVEGIRLGAEPTSFSFTHGGQTHYATEYHFRATFTVPSEWADAPPGHPGEPRIQIFFRHRIRGSNATRMACNLDAGVDDRPFLYEGMYGRFIERTILPLGDESP